MRQLPVALNAACTTAAAAALIPLVLLYPAVASAVVDRRAPGTVGYVALDAALCFGPLLVPILVLIGAAALRSAWSGERDAARLNAASLAGWGSAAALTAAVVTVP